MSTKLINLKNISLFSLCRDICRNIWVVIIIACIGVMGMYTHIKDSYVPQYTSSAIYVVTPKQSSGYVYNNKRFAESVIEVFQNLMHTDIMRNRIMEELHLTTLNATANVELITETNLMKITVTDTDPIVAFQTIGAIMDNYAELSEYLNSDAVFDTLKAPTVANNPNNALTPQKKSVTAGIVCGFLALLGVVLLNLFTKTIKTEDAVEDILDTTLLGTIYHENKNRTIKAKIVKSVKSLLITSPIITQKFIEAINNIRIKMEYEHERHPNKNVFLFTSVNENEGKSTVSINVALSLAKEGKKVIMIDGDMRKPAIYKMLDIPKATVTDYINVLQGKCGLDEVIYHERNINMDLIMATKGHTSTNEFMSSGAMSDLIKKCSEMADYVIIDTPPMWSVSDAEILLDKVDFAVLVVRQDYSHEKEIKGSLEIMENSNAKLLGCVLNNYTVFGVNRKKHAYGYTNNGESRKAVEIYGE